MGDEEPEVVGRDEAEVCAERDSDGIALDETESDVVGLAEALCVGIDASAVGEAEAEAESDSVAEDESEAAVLTEPVAVAEADTDADPAAVLVAVTERVPVCDCVDDGVAGKA